MYSIGMDPQDGDQVGDCFRAAAAALYGGDTCPNCHGIHHQTVFCANCPQIIQGNDLNWLFNHPWN